MGKIIKNKWAERVAKKNLNRRTKLLQSAILTKASTWTRGAGKGAKIKGVRRNPARCAGRCMTRSTGCVLTALKYLRPLRKEKVRVSCWT